MPIQVPIPYSDIEAFCHAHGVRELALFGSVTREDFGPDSDIDVLVDLLPDTRIGLVAFQRMQEELSGIFGRPVDLLTRSGLNRHIAAEVLRTAQIVHAQ